MLFFREALENKTRYLDAILSRPELISEVVSRHVEGPFEILNVPRHWNPGGGATLFRIVHACGDLFLKVKHRSVFVESRLESESDYIRRSSLENERDFFASIHDETIPRLAFHDVAEDFCFLAVEWLEPFERAVERLTAEELLSAWTQLVQFVRGLYVQGIVHTDIHEGNIGFRGNRLVLFDFEEARRLRQDVPFEESLDYRGENRYGNLGEFPAQTGKGRAGLTCLARLKKVFQQAIERKLPEFLETCSFDNECPFNADELQAADPRIYQSITIGGVRVAGQRPVTDTRQNVVLYLLRKLAVRGRGLNYLDVGSNMGTFCFMAARQPFVANVLGIEAFDKYVEAATLLAFLGDVNNATFATHVAGEDSLDMVQAPLDLCTVLSVYHHIQKRERFLDELRSKQPRMVLAELATQERYYRERGSVEAEIEFIRERLQFRHAVTIGHSPDYGRPLVIFTNESFGAVDRFWVRAALSRRIAPLFSRLWRGAVHA